MPKCLVLLSGGLDSTLVVKILQREGCEILALRFVTGLENATIRKEILGEEGRDYAKILTDRLAIAFRIVPLSDIYLDMFLHPKYGYGSAVNPCLDCHILMLKEAKKIMDAEGFDFVATGEVLGQRPMSQKSNDLTRAAKDSGLEGRLLRPLSAKLMPETEPEKEGLINRNNLYDISGRSRNKQMELAKLFGIEDYPTPSGGGCSIVDKVFAAKYRELRKHIGEDRLTMEIMRYLYIGRHYRLSENAKIIIGRDEAENDALEKRSDMEGFILKPTYRKGPNAFVEIYGDAREDIIKEAAALIAMHSKEETESFVIKAKNNKSALEYTFKIDKDKIDKNKYKQIL